MRGRFLISFIAIFFVDLCSAAERIGVISDIHGEIEVLEAALQTFRDEKVEAIIALGDFVTSNTPLKDLYKIVRILHRQKMPLYLFPGNHDVAERPAKDPLRILRMSGQLLSKSDKTPAVLRLGREQILVAHHPVKESIPSNVNIVLYGHTHRAEASFEPKGNYWKFNPGALTLVADPTSEPSILVLDLRQRVAKFIYAARLSDIVIPFSSGCHEILAKAARL